MISDKALVNVKISKTYKDKFQKIKESENITQGQLMEKLIDIYNDYQELKNNSDKIQSGELSYDDIGLEVVRNQDGSLKENEIEIVERALKNSNFSLQQIVKDGVLQRAKYLNSIAKNQPKLDSMTDEELKQQKFSGVAEYRINQAIETIKKHNDLQGEKHQKFCITKGIVAKITGSNRPAINKFFKDYQPMIDEHNDKHQLTSRDNYKGVNFDLKKALGIETKQY